MNSDRKSTRAIAGIHVRIDNLSFSYRRNSQMVIENLSAEFKPGTITCLTGASGAGKSTLLYLAALMLPGRRGEICWDEIGTTLLSDLRRSRLRAKYSGFVFQDAMLDPSRTVLENVMESALFSGVCDKLAKERALSLLERFGVAQREKHKPGEVSGGQAQRVALCRALVNEPSIVFADEPTGNLDHSSAATVWEALSSHARRGATVVVATHDRRLVELADYEVEIEFCSDAPLRHLSGESR